MNSMKPQHILALGLCAAMAIMCVRIPSDVAVMVIMTIVAFAFLIGGFAAGYYIGRDRPSNATSVIPRNELIVRMDNGTQFRELPAPQDEWPGLGETVSPVIIGGAR